MGETSAEKKHYKLAKRMLENFVFYIPSNVLQALNATSFQLKLLEPFLNNVYILDKMKGPILYDSKTESFKTSRISQLSKNKFALIDFKKKLEPLEFDIIFQEYFKNAFIYKSFAKLMFDELDNCIGLKHKDLIKGTLFLQLDSLEHHCNDLNSINTFINKSKDNNLDIEKIIELISNKVNETEKTVLSVPNSSPLKVNLDKPTLASKKKRIAINEQEIEMHLLQTQFNLTFPDLN